MVALLPAPAVADPPCNPDEPGTCIAPGGGGFEGGGTVGTGVGSPGTPGNDGGGVVPASGHPVRYALAPSCAGNTPVDGNVLCVAALTTCPTAGDVRYWVWTATWTAGTYGPWVLRPGTVCLGPNDPAVVPVRAQVAATVLRDWASFIPTPSGVRHKPEADTLVNVATRFYADMPASPPRRPRVQQIDRTILGLPVHLYARAEQWTWRFGDGTTATTDGPGSPQTNAVAHEFRSAGSFAAQVTITYSATYTIGDDPTVLTVRGTVDKPGATAPVRVREARSELDAS
jgi:hypothetical protein